MVICRRALFGLGGMLMVAFATISASAGDEHVIVLSDGMLVVDGESGTVFTIEASVGDVLHVFHSDPDFEHDFYISDDHYGMENGNIQALGDHHDILLDHASTFEIVCNEMPHMRITVVVTQ